MAILQPDSTIPSATAVNTDEPATTDLNHPQQLELRLFERLDQFRGIPPEKGLWRELLDLAVGTTKTFTACGKTLAASFVHHVGLALFMRANGAGITSVPHFQDHASDNWEPEGAGSDGVVNRSWSGRRSNMLSWSTCSIW